MKKRISFSGLLHKDKLMMLVSLVLAVIIWFSVVYGQGDIQARVITGVPVSITLSPFASEDLNLRIVEGTDAIATVRVEGKRSEVGALTAQDITVIADTSAVLNEGTFDLPLRVTSSGDYDIVSVVGEDGSRSTVTITCDMWAEKEFALTSEEVEKPNLTLSDTEKTSFGSPSLSGDAIKKGMVTVSGPKSDISRIVRVAAIIEDKKKIAETTSFIADLVAYDKHDRPVDSITFLNAEDSKVNVVVPIMEYYKEELQLQVLNAPKKVKDKVTVTPSTIELWALPTELEAYLELVRENLTIDFDQLLPERQKVTNSIELEKSTGVRPFSTSEVLHITMDFSTYSNSTVSIPLSDDNVKVLNLPKGYKAELEQSVLPNVVICGPRSMLWGISPKDIHVVVDATDLSAGHHTLKARIELENDEMWAYYGEEGYEIQIGISENTK